MSHSSIDYKYWGVILLSFLIFAVSLREASCQSIEFFDGFESDVGSWFSDGGVWEIGQPTSGPGSAYSGQNVAATVLGGSFPSSANARLTSPEITLPTLQNGERIQLSMWHWYSFRTGRASGVVQVAVDGSEWQTVSDPSFLGSSGAWTQYIADLSDYAGSSIRIGFLFRTSPGPPGEGAGWYIDDVAIDKDEVTSISEMTKSKHIIMYDAFPNPFTSSTLISFRLSQPEHVVIEMYDMLGRKVAMISDTIYPSGLHEAVLGSYTWSAGIYFVILKSSNSRYTRKIVNTG